jgi:hypothetical protein
MDDLTKARLAANFERVTHDKPPIDSNLAHLADIHAVKIRLGVAALSFAGVVATVWHYAH